MLDQNNIDRSSVTYWVLDRCHILCTAAVSFTSYSESQERISLQELPTVTYCFPESGETYGDDFLIEAKVLDDNT